MASKRSHAAAASVDSFELHATLELRDTDGNTDIRRAPTVEWTQPEIVTEFDEQGVPQDRVLPRQRIEPVWPTITRDELHAGGQNDEHIGELVAGGTLVPVK